ncbi:hypothetical protein, partial [Rhodovulum sulfidophilum]|uniref:hypothetical protein n=1 Tax=Rhodovulum sulfidophilum TaxID=35806 RepID=UPI001F3E6283
DLYKNFQFPISNLQWGSLSGPMPTGRDGPGDPRCAAGGYSDAPVTTRMDSVFGQEDGRNDVGVSAA